jgi:hypothetical protein
MAGRHPQKGRLGLKAIIPILTAAGSHPDCRAVLIQIVALYLILDSEKLTRERIVKFERQIYAMPANFHLSKSD